MAEILIGFVLLLLVLGGLAWPLYSTRPRSPYAGADSLGDLLARRDGLYAMLRDLDLDYELGKLDAPTYHTRREKYLARAAAVLKQLDTQFGADQTHRSLSMEIEREVAALRRTSGEGAQPINRPNGHARVERLLTPGNGNSLQCPNCGRAFAPGDRFCAKCGQAVS